jgi:nucleotide-binding universal stress UspA family protein
MSSQFQSILIPTDFSPAAWKAMQIGLDMGHKYNSRITVFHVFPAAKNQNDLLSDQLEKVRSNMEKLSKELTEKDGQDITNVVLSGNVDEALTDFVKNNHFDLVIMGLNSNGMDNTLGTHTINLITRSRIPVLVVPNHYALND